MSAKRLREQLASLTNPEPLSFDPEDEFADVDGSRLVSLDACRDEAIEIPVAASKLRREATSSRIDDDDRRYRGRVASRSKLGLGDEEWSDVSTSSSFDEEEEEPEDEEEVQMSDEAEEESDESADEDFRHFRRENFEEDVEKGKALKSQIKLWDCLLETRIKLQRAVANVNRFPQCSDVWEAFLSAGERDVRTGVGNAMEALTGLLDDLVRLQQTLVEKNEETRRQVGEKIEDKELCTSEDGVLAERHKSLLSFCDSTLSKWDEKLKISSGKVTSKSFLSKDHSILSRIQQVLADEERLRKRTQLKRSTYHILGKESQPSSKIRRDSHLHDYNDEIFDDDDFYHQMLKELIERHTSPDDPAFWGKQWSDAQKLRSKVRKNVDTKASKGRKVRYDVHTKLQNFMAPLETGTMPDSSRDELFHSLFGKKRR